MAYESDEFFKGKRPWSRIKDQILASYMNAYIAKIVTKRQPILLIDAFAGPGVFEDKKPGSPLIMCQAAERFAKGKYQAIFVNEEPEYHNTLDGLLTKENFRSAATPILGDSQELLRRVAPLLTTQSVFLYIDPFGLKDCEFNTLKLFLSRNKAYSTEIMINLCAPALHRMAARDAYLGGTGNPEQIAKWHDILTKTLGGDYWKEALLTDDGKDTKTREQMVVDGYRKKLSSTGYLTYTGSCPVQASRDSRTKYYMIFASGHPDAMILLNDGMCKAFNEYMNEQETQDTLFEGVSWTMWRNTRELERLIIEYVRKYPKHTRKDLWIKIINDHFMKFTQSEYRQAVTAAFEAKKIDSPTQRATKRLNDDCVLVLK
jgi:three-Cys-motif partner protein